MEDRERIVATGLKLYNASGVKHLLLTPEEIREIPYYHNTWDGNLPYRILERQVKKVLVSIHQPEQCSFNCDLCRLYPNDCSVTMPPQCTYHPEIISNSQTGEGVISNTANPIGRTGYSQSDLPPNKREAVKQILRDFTGSKFWKDREAWIEVTAREILNLFSEYEQVELEALGDEEICSILPGGEITLDAKYPLVKQISHATIQHNQAKGQLFRVRE